MTTTLPARPAAHRTSTETPPGRWIANHAPGPDFWVPVVLVTIVVCLQGWNIIGYPGIAGNDDEGTYLSQAWAIRHGFGLAHYTYWYDHPPLGWVQIAGLSWIPPLLMPDVPAVAAGRLVMLVFSAASTALLYTIARRLEFSRWAAALAVMLFALSPLAITMQRQIFLDNIAVTWVLAAFALALSPRKHLWSHVGAGTCAAVAVLSKETMLLVVPGVLFALWQKSHPTTRSFSVVGFFWCGFVLVGITYPMYAILKGELIPGPGHVSLAEGIGFQLFSRKGSGSIFDSGSAANDVLTSWTDQDSVFLAAGVISVFICALIPRLRAPAVAGILIVLVALRPGGYLPAMYIIQALPFFALCIAGVVQVAARAVRSDRKYEQALGIAAVAAAIIVATVGLAPRWTNSLQRALTTDSNDEFSAVSRWVEENIDNPPGTRILVDDNLWLDMQSLGFRPGAGVIWFNKLDLDPAVAATAPGGWRDIDYLISTPGLRHALEQSSLPTVDAVVDHSRVVASFGTGSEVIEIRQVVKDTP